MSILGVPLTVRLKTAKADRFITRDVSELRFASAIPGGFTHLTIDLHRPLSLDPDEIQWYGTVYVYDGRSGAVVWQGRLEDPGRGAGPDGEIWQVNAVGPTAHARDITAPYIYVDQNLERWQEQAANNTGGQLEKIGTTEEATAGLLRASLANAEVAVIGWRKGWQYNSLRETGQHLARVSYAWDTGLSQADWQVRMRFGATDLTNLEDDVDWNTAGGTGGGVITTDWATTAQLTGLSIERLVSAYTVANENAWATFSAIIVRGTVYTAAGTEDTAAASYSTDTILASQVVTDLLGRLLPKFDGPNATIATTSYAIKQLAYPDGANAAQIFDDLVVLEPGYFWAAWEDTVNGKALFEYPAWPTTVGLEASAKDGFDSPGSSSDLFNAVSVRWRDPLGQIRRNRRTNTVQALTDAGLTREALIDLSDTMGNTVDADRAGDQFLLEHAAAPNAGTLTVQSPILSLTLGRMLDPWELVRHAPGKLIRVRDVKPRVDALNATSRDAVTIFKVVGAEYSARDNSCRLALDSQPKTMTRLLSNVTSLNPSDWGWNPTRRR